MFVQVSLLHRISSIVSSGLSLEKMLDELVALTAQVTACDACLVYLVDHASGDLVLRASQLPHAAEIGAIHLGMGEGVTGWVAKNRSVVALESNAASDPRFKAFPALPEDTYEAFLSVPLVSGGELIGVINVHHREPHAHAPEEVALVSFIGEQMGGAIEKSRLAEESRSAARRMEALATLAQAISAESYLDRTLRAVAETVSSAFEARLTSIMLVNEDSGELVLNAAAPPIPEYVARRPLRIDASLIGRAVLDGRHVTVPDVSAQDGYRYPEMARRVGLVSLLAMPLYSREKVIGVLNVYTPSLRAFSDAEVDFLKVVAAQTATAVENARLMSETEEMKRTLEARKLVERAKGILQYKHHLTEQEAYLRLRNESRRLRKPMRNLAQAIIQADELERKEPVARKSAQQS